MAWKRVDKNLLVRGTLLVCLESAAGLMALDLDGKSDPYVVLSLRGEKHTSRKVR